MGGFIGGVLKRDRSGLSDLLGYWYTKQSVLENLALNVQKSRLTHVTLAAPPLLKK